MGLIKRSVTDADGVSLVSLDLQDVERHAALIREAAREEAERLLAEARAERARIMEGAAEAGHAEGHARGLAEGLEEGRQRGRDEALEGERAVLETLEAAWQRALGEFIEIRRAVLGEAKRDVIRLALLAAEKITKRAIELDPDAVADQVEAALALVAGPTALRIAVHPEDLEIVRRALPRLTARLGEGGADASVRPDDSLDRGSCVVRPEGGVAIDASIRTQFDRIVESLLPGEGGRAIGGGAQRAPNEETGGATGDGPRGVRRGEAA